VDDQEFHAELGRLLAEEVPKVRRAEVHKEIDALLRQLEAVGRELSRASHATDAHEDLVALVVKLLEIVRSSPEHAREHEGLVALADRLGGPAWSGALDGPEA
jgi:hypothetical protein